MYIKKSILLFVAFTALILSITLVNTILNYHAIPLADMWGSLEFYLKIVQGNYLAWWEPHNEHRILLSNILFWINYNFFNSSFWFLIFVNYLCIFFEVLLFFKIIDQADYKDKKKKYDFKIYLKIFSVSWLALCIQDENITWAFQSQFFLAQLLPLAAFYFLFKSCDGELDKKNFLLACFLGFLSICTMANGILALPIMVVYSVALRQSCKRIFTLVILTICSFVLYFYKYQSGNIFKAIEKNPVEFIHYILLYIGNPFYYLSLNSGKLGLWVGTLAGIFLIVASIVFAFLKIKSESRDAFSLFLLSFILYIGGTAFVTAGGRAMLGVIQATASRYTTPTLMMWLCFFIICSFYIKAKTYKYAKFLYIFLFLLMIFVQIKNLDIQRIRIRASDHVQTKLFNYNIAALALELQINDSEFLQKLNNESERSLLLTKQAIDKKIPLFGGYPFTNIRGNLYANITLEDVPDCIGNIDQVKIVDEKSNLLRISGWLYGNTNEKVPALIKFINHDSRITGFALTGYPRYDISYTVDKKAFNSGFVGYISNKEIGNSIILYGEKPECKIQLVVPQ